MRLSSFLIKNSISVKVYQQICSTVRDTDLSGPELFILAIQQRTIMSDAHIRTISNELGNLSLDKIPGERVPDLTKIILDLAR